MPSWSLPLTCLVLAISSATGAQDFVPVIPPPGSPPEAFTAAYVTSSGLPQVPPSSGYVPQPIWSPAVDPRPVAAERLTESTWYTRIDYFHWNERVDGQDFVNEEGPLLTLGYVRRVGPERFRGELFGGSVGYDGGAQGPDGSTEPLKSHTNYMGVRAEYDLLYDPEWWPAASLFVGIGTRFWFRDLPDDYTQSGDLIWGYQETWWTVYPYVGLETRRTLTDEWEFYASGRIGATAATYQHVTFNDVVLYPKLGITGQMQVGVRGRHLFLTGYFEGMTWSESAVVRDSMQPTSRMITVGLQTGFNF
jgi:hypothetical protein